MEADLATRGVTQVGPNVFGHNPRAIRLYERHGFHVTAQQMAKSIAIHPSCDITEWTGPPGR
jgi:ribosomal protein S18 acetylase RimI-like enzyme